MFFNVNPMASSSKMSYNETEKLCRDMLVYRNEEYKAQKCSLGQKAIGKN